MVSNKQKIKVLELITLFSIGGATETVVSMADGLRKKGLDVHIATGPPLASEGSMYEAATSLGIPVITFKNLRREITPIRDIIAIYEIYRFMRAEKYNIIHTHSSKAGVLGRIAGWLARTDVVIHTIHGLPLHRFQPKLTNFLYRSVEKICTFLCHKIVAVTHTIIKEMVNQICSS